MDAGHWSEVGAVTAEDEEVLAWIRSQRRVLLTKDVDFFPILAATHALADYPSSKRRTRGVSIHIPVLPGAND